jgi:hypothetical protein
LAGAFQTARDIFENPIWQNIVEFRLFFLIYGKAAFTDGVKIADIELKRGQWIRSIRGLQSDLEYKENRAIKKYSLSTLQRTIISLVKKERIKIYECELGTLFEVVNYAKYQGLQNYKNNIENAERTQREQQQNGVGTGLEQGWNNNNKDKEIKEDKEDIYTPEFKTFYKAYPNPQDKKRTFTNWKKCIKVNTIQEIMQATANYKKLVEAENRERKFIKSSANFLGQDKTYKDYIGGEIDGTNRSGTTGEGAKDNPSGKVPRWAAKEI